MDRYLARCRPNRARHGPIPRAVSAEPSETSDRSSRGVADTEPDMPDAALDMADSALDVAEVALADVTLRARSPVASCDVLESDLAADGSDAR